MFEDEFLTDAGPLTTGVAEGLTNLIIYFYLDLSLIEWFCVLIGIPGRTGVCVSQGFDPRFTGGGLVQVLAGV